MKIYAKIKRDGKWNWIIADSPWKSHVARAMCECRVCRPAKPVIDSGCQLYGTSEDNCYDCDRCHQVAEE